MIDKAPVTVRTEDRPNLFRVQIETDEEILGLGETLFLAETVEAYLHGDVAPRLIGRDSLAIDLLAADLVG